MLKKGKSKLWLKALTTEFYHLTSFSQLEPVLTTLKIIKEEGVWLEIANLIIPTLNDDTEKINLKYYGW